MALIPALSVLDGVLSGAVVQADAWRGTTTADAFRGLHLGPDDVARDLSCDPCVPAYRIALGPLYAALEADSPLARLAAAYRLTPFERACLLLVLAPDIDPRYERIYAYLQDDVTRKRPTAALALDVFCADRSERLRCGWMLGPDGTLLGERLIAVGATGCGRLTAPLTIEPQILRYVLDGSGIDARLASWCRRDGVGRTTQPPALSGEESDALERLALRAEASGEPFVVYLTGSHGTGKWEIAHATAARLGRPLLTADLRGALATGDFADAVRLALRAAALDGAVLFLHGYDALTDSSERQALRALARALARAPSLVFVGSIRAWRDVGEAVSILSLTLDRDDGDARLAAWSRAAERHDLRLPADALSTLVDRFQLNPAQIDAAVATACRDRDWQAHGRAVSVPDLARAARAQCGHALAALARRIAPERRWADLVLPDESLGMLREICDRVVHRARVLDAWGWDRQLSLGKGVTALFAGPSGTGKTLAAEVIASELGLDLFQIDLANVVSKYIGETEKNLDRVFEAARHANAVLLFDEAEALFGKRSEVRDAHDRYANLEVAYLLQKMEAFEGLAILSTNMRQNIDEAFTRRLAFTVHFPFPEEADRRRIWDIIWPAATPRADDVDAARLARELMLSGGGIKNAALAAAFYAAADGGVVTRAHVMRAARREFQKMGKVGAPGEANP
jgi:AAA+ superfamily predicted ATPase